MTKIVKHSYCMTSVLVLRFSIFLIIFELFNLFYFIEFLISFVIPVLEIRLDCTAII